MTNEKSSLKINESNANQCVSSESTISFKVCESRKIPEKLAIYLPENLDLDKVISEKPPKGFPPFQRKNVYFQKDKLAYILHLISYLPSVKKDYDYEEHAGFVPLSKQKLQKCGIKDYRPHLDYLVTCGVIIESKQYFVGEESGAIRFTSEYDFQKTRRAYITKKTLIKAIINNSTQSQIEYVDKYHYLYKWWNTQKLHVDYKNAKQYLKDKHEKDTVLFFSKYGMNEVDYFNYRLTLPKKEREDNKVKYPTKQNNSANMIVEKLHKYEYLTKVDKTAGRFHTLLTQLPKDLKQFVTYDGKQLVGIDLKNSQPLLATALLNKDVFMNNPILLHTIIECKPYYKLLPSISTMLADFIGRRQNNADVLEYRKIVSEGVYYERFVEILNNDGFIPIGVNDLRKFAKTATFTAFFAPNEHLRHIDAMKYFKNSFPSVYDIFAKIKKSPKGTKKSDKLHKALSVSLQAFEADLFLNRICKRIYDIDPEIVIFTIHDSIVTTLEYEDVVKCIIEDEIHQAIKLYPAINIEYWQKEKEG